MGDHVSVSNDTERAVTVFALVFLCESHTKLSNGLDAVISHRAFKNGDLVLVGHGNALTSIVEWPAFFFQVL